MCLAAEVPLLESGTHGYEGQAELIIKGLTKCYECEPKEKPKTFPSCTIRNTPSEPIHCIVWSKNLFKLVVPTFYCGVVNETSCNWYEFGYSQLFGEEDQLGEDSVSPDTEDPEAAGECLTRRLSHLCSQVSENYVCILGSAGAAELSKGVDGGAINRKSTREWAKECSYDPPKLFHKFFYEDIQYLLALHDLWNKRKPPKPMKFEDIPETGTGILI